jgi:hypothetical protein
VSEENIRNDLQKLIDEIAKILEPLAESVGDEAIRREILLALGLNPAQSSQSINIPPSSLAGINSYRQSAADDVDLQAFISVLADITQVVMAAIDFIRSAFAAADPNAPPGFIIDESIGRLLRTGVISYTRVHSPGFYITLKALQLIEEQGIRFGGVTELIFRTGEFFEEFFGSAADLQTEEDAQIVSDVALFVSGVIVASLIKSEFVYGYDPGPGSSSPLADAVSNRTLTLKVEGKMKDADNNEVKGSIVMSTALVPRNHGGPGLVARIQLGAEIEIPVTSQFSIKLSVPNPDFIVYMGDGSLNFPGSTDAVLGLSLIYKSKPNDEIIWGDKRGIHLLIGQAKLEGKFGTKDQEFKFEIKDSAFVLATSEADGFLRTMLGAITSDGKLKTKFDFNFGYKKGKWFVGGGMGLMMSIPLHETILFLKFNTLTIGLAIGEKAGEDPGIKLEASLSFGLDLGVLQAMVDRIGVSGYIRFSSDDDAEIFELKFKPPNGIGLSVDVAGVVRGGGFLLFDYERSEYAGGLELDIIGIISLTAICLITTKLPDGSDGFSLLAILAIEFGVPIQLGLGFTWNGIGGIFGLNRTMRLEPMAEGIKSGAMERVLFPKNIVANAAQIISDLRVFFPPYEDTFLIGAMLKIGWGTPSLVTLSLGVIIQIPPGNFAILGVLKVILPDERAAILQLKVGFLGAYEVDRERAWFYATLYDSRVMWMTLEGGMGVLISWGAESNFVISVGGFHPQFTPPPLPFPVPDRLAINILDYPLARIRVMAYFAVTSNTVQFGARAELFFGFSKARLEGHFALDVLFQFSPFYFIVEISASVSLKVFGAGLFTVRLRGSLEGPTPWRISGAASLSILFFEISVNINETWGDTVDTVLPNEAVMPLLAEELQKDANWTAAIPPGSRLLVSLRKSEATSEGIILHPLGELVVSQRAVPLGVKVDKVGNQKASDADKFTLKVDTPSLKKTGDHKEQFAMAQFQDVPDSAKLSLPPFESVPGGLRLAVDGNQSRSSRMIKRRVRYEQHIIDTDFQPQIFPFFDIPVSFFVHFIGGTAITKSELSHSFKKKVQPFDDQITIPGVGFTVANMTDNRPLNEEARHFTSEAMAREYMRQCVKSDPKMAGSLHVISQYEVNESA